MRSLVSKILLSFTIAMLFQMGVAASDLGTRQAEDVDLNAMINNTEEQSSEAKDSIRLSFNEQDKIEDEELKDVVSDEINWDSSSEARIHRVPQSVKPPVVDDEIDFVVDDQASASVGLIGGTEFSVKLISKK